MILRKTNSPLHISVPLCEMILFITLAVCAFTPLNALSPAQPNVIVIYADDLGYGDVGYQNPDLEIPTPNIDSIAKNGVAFSCGYVTAPVCGPSRAGLMTGRYQNRFGFEDNPGPWRQSPTVKVGTPITQPNFAERMKELGYVTGLVGKWHEGKDEIFQPHKRGFDYYLGFNNGAANYFKPEEPGHLVRNGKPVEMKTDYMTDKFGNAAVQFIKKNKNKPFFLYVPFNAVHGPLQAPEGLENRIKNISEPKRRTLLAMLHSLDNNVGKILKSLRKEKIEENTLLFFVSDNGGKPAGNFSYNTPLKGIKGSLYEGGIRVPFCVQWPSMIPAGQTINHAVITCDILPTAITAAGGQIDASWNFDGVNLIPQLCDNDPKPPHDFLYWRFLFQWAVRDNDWKLVKLKGKDTPELYHISENMTESTNLYSENPQIAERLKAKYDAWANTLPPPQFGWQPQFCGEHKAED